MVTKIWSHPSVKRIPPEVRRRVTAELRLTPAELDQLRCVERRDIFAGRRVKNVLIFDPSRITAPGNQKLDYEYLKTQGNGLICNARVEQDHIIYITDMRPGHNRYPTTVRPFLRS